METGRTVILLNLESLYESLYDALNQVSRTYLVTYSAKTVRGYNLARPFQRRDHTVSHPGYFPDCHVDFHAVSY